MLEATRDIAEDEQLVTTYGDCFRWVFLSPPFLFSLNAPNLNLQTNTQASSEIKDFQEQRNLSVPSEVSACSTFRAAAGIFQNTSTLGFKQKQAQGSSSRSKKRNSCSKQKAQGVEPC
jgi:hypothetical protein